MEQKTLDSTELARNVLRLQSEIGRLQLAREQDRRLLDAVIQHLGLSASNLSRLAPARDLYQMDKMAVLDSYSCRSNSESRELFFPFTPADPAVDLYGYSSAEGCNDFINNIVWCEKEHADTKSDGGQKFENNELRSHCFAGQNHSNSMKVHFSTNALKFSRSSVSSSAEYKADDTVQLKQEDKPALLPSRPNFYHTLPPLTRSKVGQLFKDESVLETDADALSRMLKDLRAEPLKPIPVECKWLLQFQAAVQQSDPLSRAQAVLDYGRRFIQKAIEIGKVILSEISLPRSRQSIPPIGVGGVAGGLKYMYDGIMFKRPSDPRLSGQNFLYGGGTEPNLERATKAAANDLRGADSYFRLFLKHDIPIIVPIQVLLEANGHRLVAMPWLPIGPDISKLVYGSADGGKTVHDSHPAVTQIMKFAAYHLHLAGHNVSTQFLYAAGDVEVHHGADGRLYLVDLARALPPEDPRECKHLEFLGNAVFFRSLRPEFNQHLQRLHRLHAEGCPPLSPDALTNWGLCSSAPTHNSRVQMATRYLLLRAKQLAEWLVQQVDLKSTFSQSFHRWGIPLRHLAYVRACIDDTVGPVGKINVEFSVECVNLVKRAFYSNKKFTLRVFINSSSGIVPLGAAETKSGLSPVFDQVYSYSGPLKGTGEVRVYGGNKLLGCALFSIAHLTGQHTYRLQLLHPLKQGRDKKLREAGAQVILCVQSVSSVGLGQIRRRELLIEMVARCLKHFLRWDLQTAIPSTEDNVIARFINLLLQKDSQSNGFWSVKLPHDLRTRFGPRACSDREAESLHAICRPNMRDIIDLILNATAIRIDQHALAQCLQAPEQSDLLFQPKNVILRDVRWKSLNFLEELMLEQTMTETSTRVRSPPEVYLLQLENTVRLAARFDDSEWIGLVREVILVAKSELELSRTSTKSILLKTVSELRLLWHRRVPPRSRLIPEDVVTHVCAAFVQSCMRAWQLLAPFWAAVDELHLREMLVVELKRRHSEFGKLLCSTAKGLSRTAQGDLTRAASLTRAATMMVPTPAEGARSMTQVLSPSFTGGPVHNPLLLEPFNANLVHDLEDHHDRLWSGPRPVCVLTLTEHRAPVLCLMLLPPQFNASNDDDSPLAISLKVFTENSSIDGSNTYNSPGRGSGLVHRSSNSSRSSSDSVNGIEQNDHTNGACVVCGSKVVKRDLVCLPISPSPPALPSSTVALATHSSPSGEHKYDTFLETLAQDTYTIAEENEDNTNENGGTDMRKNYDGSSSSFKPHLISSHQNSNSSVITNSIDSMGSLNMAADASNMSEGQERTGSCSPHGSRHWMELQEGEEVDLRPNFETGRWLVSGSEDFTMRVWDLDQAACVAILRGHKGAVRCFALHAGILVSGSADRSIMLWRQWQPARTITLEAEVGCLLSVTNGALVSGGDDGCVRIWNATFEEIHCLRGHTGAIMALCMVRAHLMCSAAKDNTLRLWEWEHSILTGPVTMIYTMQSKCGSLCLTPSPTSWLLSGEANHTIVEWQPPGSPSETLNFHEGPVNALCVLPSGAIVSGSDDTSIIVSAPGGRVIHHLKGHTGPVRSVVVGTGGQLLSASQDGSIKLWA